jgi:hypothetical protein
VSIIEDTRTHLAGIVNAFGKRFSVPAGHFHPEVGGDITLGKTGADDGSSRNGKHEKKRKNCGEN